MLVKTVMAKGKPVIIVTAAGSAINVEADCDALIHALYPGQFGGRALANILFGKTSPSGKLPVTFYEDASKLPDFSDYSMKNRTYRYAEGNILYPFGFGLTYSETECSELSYADGKASVKITNTGSRAVEDVVQFYIKGHSENAVPNHSLCGFSRVALDPGESKVVQITLPERAFMAVNEKGEWVKEGKEFTLYAGTSQPDSLSKKLTGKECTSLKINA